MEQQERERRSLAGSTQVERLPGVQDLEWPEHLVLHGEKLLRAVTDQ